MTATTATATADPKGRVTPEVTFAYLGLIDNRARFRITVSPVPTGATIGYLPPQIQIDQGGIMGGSSFDESGDSDTGLILDPGHYTARALIPRSAQYNETQSATIAFDVPEPPKRIATKTTVVPPTNPMANLPHPYTVTVGPSTGSTGRVELTQFDNVGQLQLIGAGHLKNGQVTINAAAWAGQRRIIAEFTGDDIFGRSRTAVDIFFPAGPPETDPPTAPSSTESATPMASSPMATAIPVADPGMPSTGGELAYTGTNPWPGLAVAATFIAAGVAVLGVRRRRQGRRNASNGPS